MPGDRDQIPPPPDRRSLSEQQQETQRARRQVENWAITSGYTGLSRSPVPLAVHDTKYFWSEVREVGGYFLGRLWALIKLPYHLYRKIR